MPRGLEPEIARKSSIKLGSGPLGRRNPKVLSPRSLEKAQIDATGPRNLEKTVRETSKKLCAKSPGDARLEAAGLETTRPCMLCGVNSIYDLPPKREMLCKRRVCERSGVCTAARAGSATLPSSCSSSSSSCSPGAGGRLSFFSGALESLW